MASRRRYERFEVLAQEGATVLRSRAGRPTWRWSGAGLVATSAALRWALAPESPFAIFLVLAAWTGFGLLVAEAMVATERPHGRFVHAASVRLEDAVQGDYRGAARPPSVVMGTDRWSQDDLLRIDVGRRVVQMREQVAGAITRTAATRFTVQLVFPDRIVQVADLLEEQEATALVEELQEALRVRVEVRRGADEDVLASHHALLGILGVAATTVMGAVLMAPPAGATWLPALLVVALTVLVRGVVLGLRGGSRRWDAYARRRFIVDDEGLRIASAEQGSDGTFEEGADEPARAEEPQGQRLR